MSMHASLHIQAGAYPTEAVQGERSHWLAICAEQGRYPGVAIYLPPTVPLSKVEAIAAAFNDAIASANASQKECAA